MEPSEAFEGLETTIESIGRPDSMGDRFLDLSIGLHLTARDVPGTASDASAERMIANNFSRLGAVPVAKFVAGDYLTMVFKVGDHRLESSQIQETTMADATVPPELSFLDHEHDETVAVNGPAFDDTSLDENIFNSLGAHLSSTPNKNNGDEVNLSLPRDRWEQAGLLSNQERNSAGEDEVIQSSVLSNSDDAAHRDRLSWRPKKQMGEAQKIDKTKKKRIRIEYSMDEIEAIYDGVSKFGLDFSTILKNTRRTFHKSRTAVKIYDKWRHDLKYVPKRLFLNNMATKSKAVRLKRMAEKAYYSDY
jgi:hypothetical protein